MATLGGMQTGSPRGGDLDLRSYLQTARRRWLVIVLLALLVPAISVLISLRQEARYAASSEVLVKRQNLAASLTPGQVPYTDAQTAERVVETQVQLARVPDLAERVIAAAGLTGRYTAADLLDASTVAAKPKTDILVFSVEWPSASDARALAGLYADQFTTYRRQLDTTELDALSKSVGDQLASIDRSAGGPSPLSADLRDKLRQIQTLQALQTSSAVVVRQPGTAAKVGPTPLTMGTGGLLLGLILGGALAFLLESLDTRVRKSAEVTEILGLPLLARLPAPASSLRKRSGLVVLEDPESPAAEAFAFLRTNLRFANMTSDAKVIMFGSAVEQEGKSTSISNLAVALARSGSKVVLVDLDYRRPTLHTFFSLPRSPGVTEVAAGRLDLERGLRPVPIAIGTDDPSTAGAGAADHGSLRVLPAGGVTHGIDVDAIVELLDRLRSQADVVLVDAPPLLLVGEALALGAKVDALVVIARLNHVRRPMLEELRRAFDTSPIEVLGVVATAATEEPGYSHYYRRKGYDATPVDEAPLEPRAALPEDPPPVSDPNGDAVAASGEQAEPARPAGGNGRSEPPPQVRSGGVQPRRSWAQAGRQVVPPPGGAHEVAVGSGNRTEGDGEGADG